MKPRVLQLAPLIVAIGLVHSGCTMFYTPKRTETSGVVKQRLFFTKDNFRIVKAHVEGEASCPHILMIQLPHFMVRDWGLPIATGIPIGNPDLLERAMADLHSKHDLVGKSQQFHNIVQEWDITNYMIVYADITVKVSAEVIEFIERDDDPDAEQDWKRNDS